MKDIPLPCITNKCLKYPICKYKELIDCEELKTYCIDYMNYISKYTNIKHSYITSINASIIYIKTLKHIQTTLPNIKRIYLT